MESDDKYQATDPTLIAVLGTLTEFHQDPLPYELGGLVDLVARINPDLLCLDMSMEQWRRQDFGNLPPEYSQALLPLAAQTDIVVVPIGGDTAMPRSTAAGWRGAVIRGFRNLLGLIQSSAPGPDAINQGWRHHLGNLLYGWTRFLAGGDANRAYRAHINTLTKGSLHVARSNPGSRILVVTNIQYCHHIRPQLRASSDIQVTTYFDL